MNKTPKSKSKTARNVTREECVSILICPKDGRFFSLEERQTVATKLNNPTSPTDIIARMEANQARFKHDQEGDETLRALTFALKPEFDEAAEHENDLRHESLMADESEYGPVCNLKGEQQ